jgi:hypothetical protein
MKARAWEITFSPAFLKAQADYPRKIALRRANAGLHEDPATEAEAADNDWAVYKEFERSISALTKPGKGPDTLMVVFDESASPLPNYRRLEVRPWVAFFYISPRNDPKKPRAHALIFFHEIDAPKAISETLTSLEAMDVKDTK